MRKGFSLIEVIAVVTAIGVLLLLGIPQYKKFQAGNELKNTAYLLKDTIELAKTEAQKSAGDVYVWNQDQSRDLNDAHVIDIAKENYSVVSTLKLPGNLIIGCTEGESYTPIVSQSCYITIKQNGATDDNKLYSLNLSHREVDKSYTVNISKTGSVTVTEVTGPPAGSDEGGPQQGKPGP